MQINLTTEQFLILKDLISEGMEVTLAPWRQLQPRTTKAQDDHITKVLAAAAAFNSHGMTISETGTSCP